MSNQTWSGRQDPYWVSAQGTDHIFFNKLTAPPLVPLGKGVIYELDDGLLYYNGASVGNTFIPSNPADWDVVPSTIQDALNELAVEKVALQNEISVVNDFSPVNPGDWDVIPTVVSEALNTLASEIVGLSACPVNYSGVCQIDGSTQDLLGGVQIPGLSSPGGDLFNYVVSNQTLTDFRYHLDRPLIVGESVQLSLIVNGVSIASLVLNDLSAQELLVPTSIPVLLGDKMYIKMSLVSLLGPSVLMVWSLSGTF